MIYYLPTWDRRLRTMSDWILTPIFGRDIVSVRPAESRASSQLLYEPGQVIARQGNPAVAMYAIRQGTIELVDDDHGQVVATLEAGQHFAGPEVIAHSEFKLTARAVTQVEILEIPAQQADYLHETFGLVVTEGDTA